MKVNYGIRLWLPCTYAYSHARHFHSRRPASFRDRGRGVSGAAWPKAVRGVARGAAGGALLHQQGGAGAMYELPAVLPLLQAA
jgi:hypothetical protein